MTSTHTTVEDISRDWTIIKAVAAEVLANTPKEEPKTKVFLKGTSNRICRKKFIYSSTSVVKNVTSCSKFKHFFSVHSST